MEKNLINTSVLNIVSLRGVRHDFWRTTKQSLSGRLLRSLRSLAMTHNWIYYVCFNFFLVAVLAGCQSRAQEVEKKAAQQASQSKASDSAPLLVAQGRQFLAQGKMKEAVDAFRMALGVDPKSTPAYLSLSELFMRLGKFSEAQIVLEQAVQNASQDGSVFYLLSVAHQQQGRLTPALLAARQSVEIFKASQDEDNFRKSMALVQSLVKQAGQQSTTAPEPTGISPEDTSTMINEAAQPVEAQPAMKLKQNFGTR